ncbi:MAG: hypothetical protein AAF194_01185 [Pseudomonadota bacterium]
MYNYRNMPIEYLLNNMPHFIASFADRREAAKNALNQYIGSDNTGYWKTRPEYVEELRKALELGQSCWDDPDFGRFCEVASGELSAVGLLETSASSERLLRLQASRRLELFPALDGRNIAAFLPADSLIGFTRTRKPPDWPHLRMGEPVRLRIQPTPNHFVFGFTIDPHGEVELMLPVCARSALRGSVAKIVYPPTNEGGLYPPNKPDWHQLFLLFSPIPANPKIDTLSVETVLSAQEINGLAEFVEQALQAKGELRLLNFFVIEEAYH